MKAVERGPHARKVASGAKKRKLLSRLQEKRIADPGQGGGRESRKKNPIAFEVGRSAFQRDAASSKKMVKWAKGKGGGGGGAPAKRLGRQKCSGGNCGSSLKEGLLRKREGGINAEGDNPASCPAGKGEGSPYVAD